MLPFQGKIRRGKFSSVGKILLILSYKFHFLENFIGENFRHLSKMSSLFANKVFPNKVFQAWEKDDDKKSET